MDSIEKLDYDYLFNNTSDTTINMLYDNIERADKYVIKKKKSSCFNYTITKINTVSQIPRPDMYDSHFFPHEIKTYIDENSTYYSSW